MFGLTELQTHDLVGAIVFFIVSGANYWRSQINGKKIDDVQTTVNDNDAEIRAELDAAQAHLKEIDKLIVARLDRRRPQDPTTAKVFAAGGRRETDARQTPSSPPSTESTP